MGKIALDPTAFLMPVPVTLLSCVAEDGSLNVMTVSWAGVACSTPPLIGVAIRPERHSYGLIRATGEFVLNLPPVSLLRAVDFCGMASGRQVAKFAEAHLTPLPGLKVRAPMIRECPINLECVVRNSLVLGSHVLFLAEVVATHADAEIVENGSVVIGRVAPLAYDPFGGDYWSLKEVVARQGFSGGTMPAPVDSTLKKP